MVITTRYFCPCDCGDIVTVECNGFNDTQARMSVCAGQAAANPWLVDFVIPKTAIMTLTPVTETVAYRHQNGLVTFTA